MKRINSYLLALILCVIGLPVWAQGDQIFYHTIERGQTVYAIATMYGVSVNDIYRLNPESKEGIRAGAVLRIPQREIATEPTERSATEAYRYHTIQPQETLYKLSIRYGVSGNRILQANPGLSVNTFTIGKTIRIPEAVEETQAVTERKSVTKEIDYTVQKKETMYSICRKFHVSSMELIRLNPALKQGIKAGMVLKIPMVTEETVTTRPVVETVDETIVNSLLTAPKSINRVNMVKVALLLPFMTEEKTPSATTTRFIEYYEGLLLAIDSLRNEGCSIELSVFDTGNGVGKVKEILRDKALAECNLIIGAVHNEQIGPVADFAQKQGIKYVVPFTSKNDDVLSNAYVFQVNTPHSYLYSKAAQAGSELFSNSNIIFVKTPDKSQKEDFVKAFQNDLKQKSIPFQELTYDAETYELQMEAMLDTTRHNMVLPTSGALEAIQKITPTLRMLQEVHPTLEVSLFGYPEWQTYTRECLDDFYALDTYIYSNFYADNLSPAVHAFYSKYKDWYSKSLINTFPKYGILGFDTGMFFLQAICRYGLNFEDHLDKIRYESIQTGFDFHRVNNWGGFINTQLFIVHYQNNFTVKRTEVK
ncbi:MAG: LysM peptidoglycan-binding domain-containing protein [Parabacteroides sp.]